MNEKLLKSAGVFVLIFALVLLVANRAEAATCDNKCRLGKIFLSGSSIYGTYCFEVKFDTCVYCWSSNSTPGVNLCTQDWTEMGNVCYGTMSPQQRRYPTDPCINLCIGLYTDNFASATKTSETVGDWSNSPLNIWACGEEV